MMYTTSVLKEEEFTMTGKKSDLHLLIMENELTKNRSGQKPETEDINKQGAFDFHTCFDANSIFLQGQEAGSHLQEKARPLSL